MKKIILLLVVISAGVLLFNFFIVLGAVTGGEGEARNGNKGTCGNFSKEDSRKIEREDFYSSNYAINIGAETEKREKFQTDKGETSYVNIDLVTDDYVIEAGLDKRTSLDSVQQALFAHYLTKKKPVVIIYNTDNGEGVCEYRIRKASEEAGVKYCSVDVSSGDVMRASGKNCPWKE